MAYYELNEYLFVLPNNDVKCTLCEETLQQSKLLEAHLHGKIHRELFMKSLMTANNVIYSSSNLFCYICNSEIAISELISHVQSPIHEAKIMNIKKLVLLDGGLIILPEKMSSHSSAFCIICDRDVEFIHDSLQDHIISAKHKQARAMTLQPLNGIFSVKGNDKYLWCKICQIFFDNYIELIFQHVEESDHAKKMGKIMRLIHGENINIDNYLQDYKQDKAMCNKCKIEVPCNVDNLQSHVKGKKHKSKIMINKVIKKKSI